MNRALISASLIAAFVLVGCDKPPAGGAAPATSPSPSGQSGDAAKPGAMGGSPMTPQSAASAASN